MAWSFWDEARLSRLSGQGQIVPSPHGIVPGRRRDPRQSPGSSCRAVSTKPSPELAIARADSYSVASKGKERQPLSPKMDNPHGHAFLGVWASVIIKMCFSMPFFVCLCLEVNAFQRLYNKYLFNTCT